MLASEPLLGPDGIWHSSVAPEPLVDDSSIHIETIKEWAVSQAGLQAKAARPPGYANVMAHLVEHEKNIQK
ncbi:MAG TPA: hypothetical protein VIC32_05040, partial [Terriglobales bacterium]